MRRSRPYEEADARLRQARGVGLTDWLLLCDVHGTSLRNRAERLAEITGHRCHLTEMVRFTRRARALRQEGGTDG